MFQWVCVVACVLFIAGALCSVANAADCDPSEGLEARLIRHEGYRVCPYKDTLGNWTIGVGHLMKRPVDESHCWPDSKILVVFHHDVERAEDNARHDVNNNSVWATLPRVKREVLIEMAFQLGGSGLHHFRRMLSAVRVKQYPRAAQEMRNSKWARQTPVRAQELACLMGGN